MVAKPIKYEKDGITVLISKQEYESYITELEEWLDKNQDKIIEHPKHKCIKKFIFEEIKENQNG